MGDSYIVKPYKEPPPETIGRRLLKLVLTGAMWGVFWWIVFNQLLL